MTGSALDLERQISRHLRRLCVEIGARPIGSPADHEAADYIRQVFLSAGLALEEQSLPCPAWQHQETCLELAGQRLIAAANAYSPSCDVFAPTLALGTVAELEAAELAGHIAILYGELAANPLTPKGCLLYPAERDWHIVALLEAKRPAAVITVNQRIGALERLIEDWAFVIPSATVPAEVGLALLESIGQPLHLRISTSSHESDSATIIGRQPGIGDERIVLCAHYDTKFDTPGAWDNGSGVAALLTLAEQLGKRDLGVGLELVAFSGEENGTGLHDIEYVRRAGDRFGAIIAAINMDGIGHRIRTDTVAIMAESEPFRAQVDTILKRHPAMIWTDPWPQSNHSTFAWRGIPSIAISSLGHGAGDFAHSPADTIDWVSPSRIGEVVGLVCEIVEGLSDKHVEWTRASKYGEV